MIRFKISYLILLIVAACFAVFSGGNLPYSILYMMLIILLLAVIEIIVIYKTVMVDIRANKKIISTGEKASLKIRIANESILPVPYLEIESSLLKETDVRYRGDVTSVKMDTNRFLNRDVQMNIRGIYPLGEILYRAKDVFGIIRIRQSHKNDGNITVYPKVFPINLPRIKGGNMRKFDEHSYNNLINLTEGNETVKNIREYRVGDNYKRVNWKVTAKHGKLFVKEYENSEGPRINLFLDFRKEAYRGDKSGIAEEDNVEFFISAAGELLKTYSEVGATVLSNDLKYFTLRSGVDIEEMREYFLRHFSDGNGTLRSYMDDRLTKIGTHSAVIIITNDLTNVNIDYFLMIKDKGYSVTVFYMRNSASGSMEDVFNAISRGVTCYNIEEIR